MGSYVSLDGSGRNRWGDYSEMAVDPANTDDVWTVQEYGSTSPTSSLWGTSIGQFTAVAPAVTSISPKDGPGTGGTVVDIIGRELATSSTVRFGTTAAGFTFIDSTHLRATSPAHAVVTVDVTVTTAAGTSATTAGLGWRCYDVHSGAAVSASSTLVTPNPVVRCDPPLSNSDACTSVDAGGYHADAGLGTLSVTSACSTLSVTQAMSLAVQQPGLLDAADGFGVHAVVVHRRRVASERRGRTRLLGLLRHQRLSGQVSG